MNIKKLAVIIFCTMFVLSGCGKKPAENPEVTETPAATESVQSTEKPQEEASPSAAPTNAPQKTPEKTPDKTAAPAETAAPVSVSDKMSAILQGVETPRYEIMPIDAESFESFFFVPYVDGAEAVTADALISSTAHSVCLVSLPNSANAQSFAAQVKQNADPRKWICVEAESVQVATRGNMVLLVMSDSATANAIVSNFNK